MDRSPTSAPASRRVDAERNRERILAAAREAFADPEAEVSMAEVARRAGIGSATLYRNFANRRALLEALYVDEINAVCAAASTSEGATPGARLAAWLRRFYAYFTSKRFVAAELLEHTGSDDPVFGTGFARIHEAAEPLVRAARQSDELTADLTTEQILALVAAVAKIPGGSAYRAPILDATLAGLVSPRGG